MIVQRRWICNSFFQKNQCFQRRTNRDWKTILAFETSRTSDSQRVRFIESKLRAMLFAISAAGNE
jgi:hypothetical protein